jgi:hypothetical protein
MAIKKNNDIAETNDKEQIKRDKDRRSKIERREYEYFSVIPERRSVADRRKNTK